MDILLIHPPVVKPSEPPAGLARLCGALRDHGRSFTAVDANIEGLLHILGGSVPAADTWTKRAMSHLDDNIAMLRDGRAFANPDRYVRAVTEINRVLVAKSAPMDTLVSLSNFTRTSYSPVKSRDLIRAADNPEGDVFYDYFSSRLTSLMERHAPGIVGLSVNYLSQALTAFSMIGFLRRLSPVVKIILGGGLVTSWMRTPGWSDPFRGLVDEFVEGPGEERVLSLAGAAPSGDIPLPDYSEFNNNAYLSPRQVLPFSTSVGCYWGRCSFCPEQAEGSRYSNLSAGRAMEDFDRLASQSGDCLIHVCDNAVSPAFLKAMTTRETPVPWYGFARVTDHLADRDFCSGLRRSGCVMLKLGLESGDQGVLDALCKGIRIEDSVKALRAIKEAGMATYVYLLFGTPEEDRESALKTMDFIVRHSDLIDFLNISIFNLPRGGREAASLETYDFSDGDLSLYRGFIHPKGWERKVVRQFLDKEFKRQPAIARIVRMDPPAFTSNHAPFFVLE